MLFTFIVLKFDRFTELNEEQLKKRYCIVLAFFVLKLDRSKDFNDVQLENI